MTQKPAKKRAFGFQKAGDGNRTRVNRLEICGSAAELLPHSGHRDLNSESLAPKASMLANYTMPRRPYHTLKICFCEVCGFLSLVVCGKISKVTKSYAL